MSEFHRCHHCGTRFRCARTVCYLDEDTKFILCDECYQKSPDNHAAPTAPAAEPTAGDARALLERAASALMHAQDTIGRFGPSETNPLYAALTDLRRDIFAFLAQRQARPSLGAAADGDATLAEIEKRWEAATPGPWRMHSEPGDWAIMAEEAPHREPIIFCGEDVACMPSHQNAEAIAAAPTDIRYLLAEVRRLREMAVSERGSWIDMAPDEREARRRAIRASSPEGSPDGSPDGGGGRET